MIDVYESEDGLVRIEVEGDVARYYERDTLTGEFVLVRRYRRYAP